MANNITIKDGNGLPITIRTWEESTSVHNNASIPINVSGLPIFTTAAPGIVCVAGIQPVSVDNLVRVVGGVSSGEPDTSQFIPVGGRDGTSYRIAFVDSSGSFRVQVSNEVSIADNAPVSVRGGVINIGAAIVSTPNTNIITVANPGLYTIGFNYFHDATDWRRALAIADNADGVANSATANKLAVVNRNTVFNRNSNTFDFMTGTSLGINVIATGVSLGGSTALIGSVSISPNGLNIPVSIAPPTFNIPVSIANVTGNIGVSVINPTFNLPVSVHPVTQSGTWNVGLNAGSNLIGAVSVRGNLLGSVSITNIADVSVQDNAPVSVRGGQINAIQSGTWTVQPGNTANTTPWLVSVNSNIAVSVQNVVNVSISPAGLNIPVSVANNPILGANVDKRVIGAVSLAGISPVSIAGIVTVDSKSNTGDAVPAGAFFVGGTDGTNLRGLRTLSTGELVVHVSNSLPTVSGVTQLVSIGGAVSTQAVQIAGRDVNGDARSPRMTTGGTQFVTEVATSSGTLLTSSIIVSAYTSGYLTKGAAGNFYGISGFNTGSTPLFLRLFDKATAPAAADTPKLRYIIPGNTAGAGFVYTFAPGISFTNGIGWRISGAYADNDATNPADNQGFVNIMYR